jgi:phospholipid/cholesterol/gamma-HCH transport system substrate-binding protein
MEKREVARQIRLGVFVLGGIALFLTAVFLIGSENNIFSRTFTIAAVFRNVEGLKPGDNVWLSGVKVGTVSDVRIVNEGEVIVHLALRERQNQFIYNDAIASIGSDGLVGSKIVVIRPGKSGRVVTREDTLQTLSPTDTQDILELAKDVGENTRIITEDLRRIAEGISAGRGIVGELLNEGALAQDIRSSIQSLRVAGANTARASSELQSLVSDLRSGPGLIPMLVSDTGYASTFQHVLANLEKVSVEADEFSSELRQLTKKVNDSDNAVGVLLSDTAVAMNLKETIENVTMASGKLDENMEALRHNFLFRRYFRRQERQERREAEAASSKANGGQ